MHYSPRTRMRFLVITHSLIMSLLRSRGELLKPDSSDIPTALLETCAFAQNVKGLAADVFKRSKNGRDVRSPRPGHPWGA